MAMKAADGYMFGTLTGFFVCGVLLVWTLTHMPSVQLKVCDVPFTPPMENPGVTSAAVP